MLQSIAARRLRCRAGPATTGSVPTSSGAPVPAAPADGSSDRRSSSWSMSWCGASTRSAAAASSMASGMPSRRRQIVAARIAFVGVASMSGRLTRARARNSSTAGLPVSTSGSVSSAAGTGRGSTQTTRSRGTPIAIRLVARIVRPGVRARRSVRAGAAARTCSTVSRTRTLGARPSASATLSTMGLPGSSATPKAPAIAGSTSEGSLTPSSGTNATRPSRRGIARRVSSTARRLLPTPPIPASVMNVRSRPSARRRTVATSASRPISGASGTSGTAPGQHGSTDPGSGWADGAAVGERGVIGGCIGSRGYDATQQLDLGQMSLLGSGRAPAPGLPRSVLRAFRINRTSTAIRWIRSAAERRRLNCAAHVPVPGRPPRAG